MQGEVAWMMIALGIGKRYERTVEGWAGMGMVRYGKLRHFAIFNVTKYSFAEDAPSVRALRSELSDDNPKRHEVADTRSPEQRRRIMQSVKTRDTGPELAVRRVLSSLGYRYRLNSRKLPGRPDIVLPGKMKVIFVHGCFWHAHGCRKGRAPKSRLAYWKPKLKNNRKRDAAQRYALKALGWSVLTIWQCETNDTEALGSRLSIFLEGTDG
jgi:DNA mismatch endonuclease (patch repair protein)